MNILITGGAGFIGLNVIVNLVAKKKASNIFIVDDFSNSSKKNIFDALNDNKYLIIKKTNLIKVNNHKIYILNKKICNLKHNNKIFNSQINTIIHLAAQTGVPKSISNPIDDAKRNILDTLNILEIAKTKRIKKIIFASSIGVIGDNRLKNNSPKPISPYACSKYSAEHYLRIYSELYNIHTVSLRFANVYGKYSMNKGSVVAKFIKNILNKDVIKINGDGNQSRDFIYADDLAKIIIRILFYKSNKIKKINYINVATGKSRSINTLLRNLNKIYIPTLGHKFKIKHVKSLDGEIKISRPDNKSLIKILSDFEFIDFKLGLKKTFDWWSKI